VEPVSSSTDLRCPKTSLTPSTPLLFSLFTKQIPPLTPWPLVHLFEVRLAKGNLSSHSQPQIKRVKKDHLAKTCIA